MRTVREIQDDLSRLNLELRRAEVVEKQQSLAKEERLRTGTDVRVVCDECGGRGRHSSMSAGGDNMDWDEYDCDACDGRGFVVRERWKGRGCHG